MATDPLLPRRPGPQGGKVSTKAKNPLPFNHAPNKEIYFLSKYLKVFPESICFKFIKNMQINSGKSAKICKIKIDTYNIFPDFLEFLK